MEEKVCFVCGGKDTDDGGVKLEDKWFCGPGCWADYHVGKAALKVRDKTVVNEFIKNIKDK